MHRTQSTSQCCNHAQTREADGTSIRTACKQQQRTCTHAFASCVNGAFVELIRSAVLEPNSTDREKNCRPRAKYECMKLNDRAPGLRCDCHPRHSGGNTPRFVESCAGLPLFMRYPRCGSGYEAGGRQPRIQPILPLYPSEPQRESRVLVQEVQIQTESEFQAQSISENSVA